LREEAGVASSQFGQVPFGIVVALLGFASLGVVVLGLERKLGAYSLLLLAVPLVIAAVYLSQYSRRPDVPSSARVSGAPMDPPNEPFDDPVEEADRIASTPTTPGSPPPSEEGEPPSDLPPEGSPPSTP
jgi:hypothetical protein